MKNRYLFILNGVISSLGLIFIVVSLGTDNWIHASPENEMDRGSGDFNAGLFKGRKRLPPGEMSRNYYAVQSKWNKILFTQRSLL